MDNTEKDTKKAEELYNFAKHLMDEHDDITVTEILPIMKASLFFDPDHALSKAVARASGVSLKNPEPPKDIARGLRKLADNLDETKRIRGEDHKTLLRYAMAVNPNDHMPSVRLLKQACADGDIQEAEKIVEDFIREHPGPGSYILMSCFYRYQRKTDAAFEWIEKAVEQAVRTNNPELFNGALQFKGAIFRDITLGKCPPAGDRSSGLEDPSLG